jgi:hypothetical protein
MTPLTVVKAGHEVSDEPRVPDHWLRLAAADVNRDRTDEREGAALRRSGSLSLWTRQSTQP